ncbi:MAG: DUF2079 domain-containing protein [Candidatus Levybacteria bacterium]|nr:DUF2079 domain-containing protein [Candidatus Levybacteria bacterium]
MAEARLKDRAFSVIKFALGWPISLIALFFLGRTFLSHGTNIAEQLQSINLSLLIPGMLCFIIYYFFRSFVWYKIIRFAGHPLDPRESLFLWSFTQLRRYIPGNIWAALGVATQYGKKGISKKDVGTFILWETEIVIIAGVFLSILAIPFVSRYYLHLNQLQLPLTIGALLLASIGLIIYCYNRSVIRIKDGKIKTVLEHIFPSFRPFDTLQSILYIFSSFIFLGLGYFFVITSLTYLDPNLMWQFIGFFMLSLLVGFVSVITPSGLGVREGVLTIFLGNLMTVPLAAFASLFCRLVLIICEVIFIGISYAFHKIRTGKFNYIIQYSMDHAHVMILSLSYVMFSWYFSVVSFLRFENFYTGRFDLGNMAQTVWNSSHGRIFEFINPNGMETVSRLAFHADVILVAFAPLYLIWEDPRLLLLLQVVIVGAGAFFVYAIATHFLKDKTLSLIISALYLLNPSVQRSIIYDFHAVTLATTFVLGAMYFIFKKRYGHFVIFAVLAGLCKEQVWAVTGLMGIYIAVVQRQWKVGTGTFLISLFIAISLIWYIIPHAAGGMQHFALEYYSSSKDESSSPSDLIKKFISSPKETFELITQESRVIYFQKLLEPLGYLPLLAPIFLIFALPDLTINILSAKSELYQIYYQYTAIITPFLFIALTTGLAWLLKKFTRIPKLFVICYLLFVGLYGAYQYGPLPGAKEPNTDMFTKQYQHKNELNKLLDSIPVTASVSTTNSIGSHLSHRRFLYNVPFAMESADIVIIDKSDDNLPSLESNYASKSAILHTNPDYEVFYTDENVTAYKKKNFKL